MKPIDLIYAVLVTVLWGGNFIAVKYGVQYFPPFFYSALRFTLVSLLMLPFVPRPSLAQMKRILPASVLAALHFSLLFVALYYGLDISTGALVGQLGVPFSCILGAIFLGDKIGPWRILGIIIAFGGIIIVAGTPNILTHPLAFAAALGSTFAWGIANIFVKKLSDVASQQLLAWMSLCTVPTLLIFSVMASEVWPPLAVPPATALAGLTYTAIGSTVGAYGLWYYLLSRYTVSQVAPFSLLTPVFGISFGELFFKEELTPQILLGGLITIVGVAIIVIRRPKLAIIAEAT